MTRANPVSLTPEEVEGASDRDQRNYELINGALREKPTGVLSQLIAGLLAARLNARFFPTAGFAVVAGIIYCFNRPNHGRRPHVCYVGWDRLKSRTIPKGDLFIPPDLVVEVLSPGNSGMELEQKLNEYLEAGIPLVWIVNPEGRTIRVYRDDGTTRVYRGTEVIDNEPRLPGFRLVVDEIFPEPATRV